MTLKIAVHQPNFFPWLGYFDKIAKADRFVFLDDAQFPLKGGTYMNRVSLLSGAESKWFTAPVERIKSGGGGPINQTEFKASYQWRRKLLEFLKANYAKTPYFREVFDFTSGLLENQENNVALFNSTAIKALVTKMGLDSSHCIMASDLETQGKSTRRLISLVHSLEGGVYLCGGGAGGYQDDALFAEHGVVLEYQHFEHPVYPQNGSDTFTPGLSVLDALMNMGFEGTGKMLGVT